MTTTMTAFPTSSGLVEDIRPTSFYLSTLQSSIPMLENFESNNGRMQKLCAEQIFRGKIAIGPDSQEGGG